VDNIFILLIVAITSAFTYLATQHNNRARIREAIGPLFEYAGMFTLFFAANIAFGVLIIFVIRTFTPRFMALYTVENVLLLILSAAQAFVFHRAWKR
jgi:hypothetical protein